MRPPDLAQNQTLFDSDTAVDSNASASDASAARELLEERWNAYRGEFSPLPDFSELIATFRVQSLAAAHDDEHGTVIAIGCGWDSETITEKLRPFRNRLSEVAPHRVDIGRVEGGVLVEEHEFSGGATFYLLRHGPWIVFTSDQTSIPRLAQGMTEQTVPMNAVIQETSWVELAEAIRSVPATMKIDDERPD